MHEFYTFQNKHGLGVSRRHVPLVKSEISGLVGMEVVGAFLLVLNKELRGAARTPKDGLLLSLSALESLCPEPESAAQLPAAR